MSESLVEGMEGLSISKGQLIGRTGQTNDFDHLHFEIRAGGLRQDSNCNPWKFLPCEGCSSFNVNLTVIPNEGGEDCSVMVQVSVPPNQLTFNRVRLLATGGMINYDKNFDLCSHNKYYTNNPTYSPSRLDNPFLIDYPLMIIPHFFNSQSFSKNQWSATDYNFKTLPVVPGDTGMVTAYVYDVFDNEVLSSPVNYSCLTDPVSLSPSSSTETIYSTIVPSPSSTTGAVLSTGTPYPSFTSTESSSTSGTICNIGMNYIVFSIGLALFYLTVLCG